MNLPGTVYALRIFYFSQVNIIQAVAEPTATSRLNAANPDRQIRGKIFKRCFLVVWWIVALPPVGIFILVITGVIAGLHR